MHSKSKRNVSDWQILGHVLTSLLQERLGKWVSAMISSALCYDLWGVRFSRHREMVQMLTHQKG